MSCPWSGDSDIKEMVQSINPSDIKEYAELCDMGLHQILLLQIYGVPSVRRDITAPKKQSIANDQNYGNEPNSRQLISPASSSERGLAPQQLQQQLSHEALRCAAAQFHCIC